MMPSSQSTLDANQITDNIWCGATLGPGAIPALEALGIKRVVNLETLARYSPGEITRAGMDFVNIPIRDADIPLSHKVIDDFVAAVHEPVLRGEHVYIHCTAGWQRSPALVACYLVFTGMPAEEALATVRQKRPVARFYSSHIASVIMYETRLGARRTPENAAAE